MPLAKSSLVDIRDFTPNDRNFILASWLMGLRYGNEWFSLIDKNAYFSVYEPTLKKILSDPRVTVKVACLKEEPGVILGYAVYKGEKLHWVHVKAAWRKIGIAKSLVPEAISVVTHLSKAGLAILRKKCPEVSFNPFLT